MTSTSNILPHVSRRSVAKGIAWSAPTIALATAAPAMAASTTPLTATNVTPQAYVGRYYNGQSSICNGTGGYLDTQGMTPTGGPKSGTTPDGDGLLSTTSIGYWLETTNTTSGVARINSVTTVYTFNNPIVIDACPNGTYNSTGAWRWTQCTTLNGWTYSLSADGKTLTMTYNKPTIVNTSTAALRTGTYLPGYFINYHVVGGCTVAVNTTISTTHTMNYATKTAPGGTAWTRTVTARPVV